MVNFEDGELVKGAYVVIDGKEYEVHMPQYSGRTPLSSENLNKVQNDLNETITNQGKILNDKINGTVIYENENGSDDNIELTQNIEKAKRMKIEFYIQHGSKQYDVKEVLNPHNKIVTLGGVWKDNTQDVLFVNGKTVFISGNTIQNIKGGNANQASMEFNTVNGTGNISTVPILITKVIIYDY